MQYKQGYKVFVEKKIERRSKNWSNVWADDMDEYIGHTYTVKYQNSYGVYFEEDDAKFGFPPSVLRLIKLEDAYLFQTGDMVEVTEATPDWYYWVDGMHHFVGGIYKVGDNSCQKNNGSKNRIQLLDEKGNGYYFPCDAVRMVAKRGKYHSAPKPPPPPKPTVEPLQSWERF